MLEGDLTLESRRQAETVRRSGEVLLGLINGVLDFSKIEAGKLELELIDFDPREIVRDVATLVEERAKSKGLVLVVRVHPLVPRQLRGDPTRLRQVLMNLVSNAVKFTEPGGDVVIRSRLLQESNETVLVRFEVQDTGIGIAPEARERLFQPFSQADGSTSRHYGGTCFGLAISKRLVLMMGGEINVESAPGWGSTFWFSLNLPKCAVARGTGAEVALQPTRGPVCHVSREAYSRDVGEVVHPDLAGQGIRRVGPVGTDLFDTAVARRSMHVRPNFVLRRGSVPNPTAAWRAMLGCLVALAERPHELLEQRVTR